MNFDLWCQEQAHLPAARCDKRTPEDEKTFEAYRAQIERYEVPYLQQRQHDLSINRDIMHNDPVDNPVSQNPQAQTQDPNRQPPDAAALERLVGFFRRNFRIRRAADRRCWRRRPRNRTFSGANRPRRKRTSWDGPD